MPKQHVFVAFIAIAFGEMIGFAQLASYSRCPERRKKSHDFCQDAVKDKTDLLAIYVCLQPGPGPYRPSILMKDLRTFFLAILTC